MTEDNKVHIFNRLFFKLYRNYAIMIVVAASLIGFLFYEQYYQTTTDNSKTELTNQAEIISEKTAQSISENNQNAFLSMINNQEEINGWDIWTVSRPDAKHPMGERMETGLSYNEIAAEGYSQYVSMLDTSFQGDKAFSVMQQNYVYQQSTFLASAPIQVNGEVVGAVLVILQQDEISAMLTKTLKAIIASILVALGISFVIVIVFATKLSLPISRMRATALDLAAGNYNSKTGIERNDEIGDLAKTVDILSEKLLENDLMRKKLDQMRFDFFANVSHELRTPITVIRAYTETLVDGVVQDKEKIDQYYDRMLSECKSMERLVADLLILSKMQNPDFKIEKEPVNLQQVFEDILRSAGAIAEKKSIMIEIITDDPTTMIMGDYDRLRQMFMVILDNAIKFSDEYKTVHIKLVKEDKIKVSIRDEGIGIEACDVPYIFEKFYKSNLRQNASGTGLGLAIARQIAIKHEGSIEVDSTPGIGTEFIFTFPALSSDETAIVRE